MNTSASIVSCCVLKERKFHFVGNPTDIDGTYLLHHMGRPSDLEQTEVVVLSADATLTSVVWHGMSAKGRTAHIAYLA
jgi:hypothetical protein